MYTNLRKIRVFFKVCAVFILFTRQVGFSQECKQNLEFEFKPSISGANFKQFPAFSLPFDVIYAGSPAIANAEDLLNRGFSHISNPNGNVFLDVSKRAFIYYGVANANQAWDKYKSPYGNDLNAYHKKWDEDLNHIKQQNNGSLNFDVFCLDIEMQHKSKDSILAIQKMSFIPTELKSLGEDAFVVQYQKDMQNLYAYAANYIKNKVNARVFTSYGDVPVFNTFTNIQGPSWEKWQSDPSLLYYISQDFNKKKAGGPYYDAMDKLSPNAYFYYDYPHIFAPEYLSYLLFQIEVNQAWSPKDQYVFLWNRYSYTQQFVKKNIKPWMSEAMAIFPFFSGAKGLWLWEDPTDLPKEYSNYEYFMKGLYRLSKFKSYFEGNYELVKTVSARDYNDNQMPIWRGVFKNGKLLVAAHNPWAKSESEEVKITVQYGTLNKQITLKGYEVFLCEFEAEYVLGLEETQTNLTIYPNPAKDRIFYTYKTNSSLPYQLKIYDTSGKIYLEKTDLILKEGFIEIPKNLKREGILMIDNGKEKISKRIIIHE